MILTPHYSETVENDILDMSGLSCLLARSTQKRFGTLVVSDGMPMQEVVELRKEIDELDDDIFQKIASRMKVRIRLVSTKEKIA